MSGREAPLSPIKSEEDEKPLSPPLKSEEDEKPLFPPKERGGREAPLSPLPPTPLKGEGE